MIKCIVVDDEPLAQEVLESHITRNSQLQLVAKCNHAMAAFNALHREQVDLIFLDIRMPAITGIDFIKSLKTPPKVIFTTAFAEHAITGFELDAVDYLLKPVTYEMFEKSIKKLLRVNPIKPDEEKNYTYFKISGKLVKVFHEDLLFAQSVKDYILLQTKTARYLTHMTMKYINGILPDKTFVRLHRSFIVNKKYIDILGKNSVQIGTIEIPIGEQYRPNLTREKLTG